YCAANAYLDTLAEERRRLGRPALAINWGVLGEVGVVTRDKKLTDHFRRMGLGALSTREALFALGCLMREDATRTAGFKVDWGAWAAGAARMNKSPRYALLTAAKASGEGGRDDARNLRDALASAPGEELPRLQAYLRDQIGKVLRTPSSRLEADLP